MNARNIEDYYKTVDILVHAYANNLLQPLSCAACVCGHIVAGFCGFKVVKFENNEIDNFYSKSQRGFGWEVNGKLVDFLFFSSWQVNKKDCFLEYRKEREENWNKISDYIPYTGEEIIKIESIFMNYNDSYTGLLAVVDYLGELYDIENSSNIFQERLGKQNN